MKSVLDICRSAGTGFLENLFRDVDREHLYVVRLILVQYLALCGGSKAVQLFSRVQMARSRMELSHIRVACFEEIARQRHQSLAQEMVDLIHEASEDQIRLRAIGKVDVRVD